MRKVYNSFEEVDKDIKILKLKKEITVWSIKNNANRFQNILSLKHLTVNLADNFKWKNTLRNLLVGYLIKRIIKR